MILLLLALLPLDLIDPSPVPSTANGLRLEAVVEDGLVQAELVNVGVAPIRVGLGFSCSGPTPFAAVVDGVVRPFASPTIDCDKNVTVIDWIAAGRRRRIASASVILDGEPHRVAVRYVPGQLTEDSWRGALTSAPIAVAAGPLAIELIAKPGAVRDGALVTFDIVHRWRGPAPIRFMKGWLGACGGPIDVLLLDGEPRAFFEHVHCDAPSAPDLVVLAPGERYVTHGRIALPPGHHRLRARYGIDDHLAATVGGAGHSAVYVGRIESPEVVLPF